MIQKKSAIQEEITISSGKNFMNGFLHVPTDAKGLVLFAHGSGSTRFSPRNQLVARFLSDNKIATLLFDLLSAKEEEIDNRTRELRFNIPFLAERLMQATDWVSHHQDTHHLTLGYFGASTGAAAALIAAAELEINIKAIVSRGGRPDLAGQALSRVQSPTLLIVGGEDFGVIELNQQAFELLECKKKIEIVPGATHLFEEPGALEEVGRMASLWFSEHL
jgi:putative phosphoribosyl transferase